MYSDVAVIIPARIGSTRLAAKMLELIGEQTMIEHVISRLQETKNYRVFVATDSQEIFSVAKRAGASAIMTDENCPSGTDRVYEALKKMPECDKIKYVINVQGDMPFINGEIISEIINKLKNTNFDIVTPVVKVDSSVADSPSNVKVVVGMDDQALYFSRSLIPSGTEEFLYHIGVYGFKVEALEKFVALEQSYNEKRERLEQLRALDNNMTIGICYANEVPISVDTPEDLIKARSLASNNILYRKFV